MPAHVNVKDLTGKLNQLRMDNLDRLYSRNQIIDELKSIGFSNTMAQTVLSLIPSKRGKKRQNFYQFGKDPIHFSKVEGLYEKNRKTWQKWMKSSKPIQKEALLKELLEAGYQIRKPVGFDEARFRKDHPDLWAQYQVYESI